MSATNPPANPAEPSATKSKKNNKKKNNKKTASQKNAQDSKPAHGPSNGEPTDDNAENEEDSEQESPPSPVDATADTNGPAQDPPIQPPSSAAPDTSTDARLEAAAKERDELRTQVTELRKSLEEIQSKHEDELAKSKASVEQAEAGKDHAESRYQKLLGQVNTIKTQLGERLKSDAAELAQAREQIEELEEQAKSSGKKAESFQEQINQLEQQKSMQAQEIDILRGRTSLSQANWAKERDDLVQREARMQEEYEAAKQAMQDWEVLATEERSNREGLSDRVAELEDQLSSMQQNLDGVILERDSQAVTVDGLQRAIQEIHEGRKQERRELVESSEAQLDELRKALKIAEQTASEAQAELQTAKTELERTSPFEKEVKEKNLLIGKLRHEAVILNDHLTKALRFLKRGKPEDNVDRQLVTNHFLHFLALDRTDPKKFQILLLIAALLGWTEEQKEQAGLARPGASTSTTLRVPLSAPFRRASSTASLNPLSDSVTSPTLSTSSMTNPFGGAMDSPSGKESLAELWSDFLEREAEQGMRPGHSRRGSATSVQQLSTGRSGVTSPPAVSSPSPRKQSQPIAEEETDAESK